MSLQPRQQKHRALTLDNQATGIEAVFVSSVFYLSLLTFAIKPDTKLTDKLNMLPHKTSFYFQGILSHSIVPLLVYDKSAVELLS